MCLAYTQGFQMDNVSFVNCSGVSGGALKIDINNQPYNQAHGSSGTLSNSNFIGNYASGDGGAIAMALMSTENTCINIFNCEFDGDYAAGNEV